MGIDINHFSLFSGIGGIDLAAEWAGFKTVGQCEIDPYCNMVLEKHWPDVLRWKDVRLVQNLPRVNLLTAGIPCQEHSTVNQKRTGDLFEWNETFRIIRESHPDWVLIENVEGILSTGHSFIVGQLEEEGYETGTYNIPALAVGAPHRRYRVFIVAHAKDKSGLQANTPVVSVGEVGETWRNACGGGRGFIPGTYWEKIKPPIPGMDDGDTDRFHKDRVKTLGNMVVPAQVYPILKAMAEIIQSGV